MTMHIYHGETMRKKISYLLCTIYRAVHDQSTTALWRGRLMAVPTGIIMMIALPCIKLIVFGEDLGSFLFRRKGIRPSLKALLFDLGGVILSPLIALCVGIAISLSLLNSPKNASSVLISSYSREP